MNIMAHYSINLFTGGRLIRAISEIPNIRQIDTDKSFVLKILIISSIINFTFNLIGATTFSHLLTDISDFKHQLRSMFLFFIWHPVYFISECMATFLFVYTMVIFKKCFANIDEELNGGILKIILNQLLTSFILCRNN